MIFLFKIYPFYKFYYKEISFMKYAIYNKKENNFYFIGTIELFKNNDDSYKIGFSTDKLNDQVKNDFLVKFNQKIKL